MLRITTKIYVGNMGWGFKKASSAAEAYFGRSTR